jgi:hypothetical protein
MAAVLAAMGCIIDACNDKSTPCTPSSEGMGPRGNPRGKGADQSNSLKGWQACAKKPVDPWLQTPESVAAVRQTPSERRSTSPQVGPVFPRVGRVLPHSRFLVLALFLSLFLSFLRGREREKESRKEEKTISTGQQLDGNL